MSKIGIIGAMESEIKTLVENMAVLKSSKKAGMEFREGKIGNTEAVVAKSGIGKVNAAVCAQILIDDFQATHIINTGVAGSLCAELNIGDIVVGTDAVEHDFDVSPIGFKRAEIPYTGRGSFETDPYLRELAVNAIKERAPDIKSAKGRILSGDQFIASAEKKNELIEAFGGLCAEMEGGAIAQTCYMNNIPFVVMRAISDKADDDGVMNFAEFEQAAAKHCADAVLYMVEKFNK